MFEKNAKKEMVRQTISLSSTFKFLFHLSTLCNNSSLDFYFLLECDTLLECIISALTRTQTLFLLTWQCMLASSWVALRGGKRSLPLAQCGPKGRESQLPSLCWAAGFSPMFLTLLRCYFMTSFLGLGALMFILALPGPCTHLESI